MLQGLTFKTTRPLHLVDGSNHLITSFDNKAKHISLADIDTTLSWHLLRAAMQPQRAHWGDGNADVDLICGFSASSVSFGWVCAMWLLLLEADVSQNGLLKGNTLTARAF